MCSKRLVFKVCTRVNRLCVISNFRTSGSYKTVYHVQTWLVYVLNACEVILDPSLQAAANGVVIISVLRLLCCCNDMETFFVTTGSDHNTEN